MRVVKGKTYGVITGDIVSSSALSKDDRRKLLRVLRKGSVQIRRHFAEFVTLDVNVFSGDSWQILVNKPTGILRVALFYRAFLRANMSSPLNSPGVIDTRMVIALGPIDFVPGRQVTEGDGPAFQASGRLLAEQGHDVRMRLVATTPTPSIPAWDAAIRLIDAIVQRQWTAARCWAVCGQLRGLTQAQTGRLWPTPIKQASVADHLRGADWWVIRDVLEQFEQHNIIGET